MRSYLILALAAAIGIGVAQTGANAPADRPAPFAALKTYLSLTDAQVTAIQQIHQQSRTANQDIAKQVREKQQAVRELIRSGSTDTNAIAQLQSDLNALRNQLKAARASVHDQVLTVLTPDQKTKVATLEEAAKLQREIREAGAAGILTPPDDAPGLGIGPGPRGRGMGMGPGAGPRGMMGRGRGGRAPVQ